MSYKLIESMWVCSMCRGVNYHKLSCKTPSIRKEEKMVPLSLVDKAFDAGFERGRFVENQPYVGGPLDKEEWLEQNVR